MAKPEKENKLPIGEAHGVDMSEFEQIKNCLATELAAQLKLHAASCEAVDYRDGVLTLKLLGGCSGCPSSQAAIFNSIVPVLQKKFPHIKDVLLA